VSLPIPIEKTQRFLQAFCIGRQGARCLERYGLMGYLLCKPLGESSQEDVYALGVDLPPEFLSAGLRL